MDKKYEIVNYVDNHVKIRLELPLTISREKFEISKLFIPTLSLFLALLRFAPYCEYMSIN